jgi:large subunit ribosomal protein L24
VTRAEGAELTVTGNVDLMEQTMSARLALSTVKEASQAAGDRPIVSIFLSGPMSSPKRAVDVSALTAWLTLRAVEQQSKQLEAMEAKRRLPMMGQPAEDPLTTSVAPPTPSLPTPMQAPALPPAIEVPALPSISEQKPPRAPARTPSGTAAKPRPVPARPPLVLPSSPDN